MLPPPRTAISAIRGLEKLIREGTLYFRGQRAGELRAAALAKARVAYEAAPPDELVFPIGRTGDALKGPGGTLYLDRPDFNSDDGYGYDRIATRARRSILVVVPIQPALPESWSALFFERISWPLPVALEGQHLHRRFLRVEREGAVLDAPIHDATESWGGGEFKVRPFPTGGPSKFTSYIVFADRIAEKTLYAWLTLYLAQRGFLTPNEETRTVAAFIACAPASRSLLLSAQLAAYERAKRRFVQPIAGRPSFGRYLQRNTQSILNEARGLTFARGSRESGGEPAESLGENPEVEPVLLEPPSRLLEMGELRFLEPSLYRALLDRISKGQVEVVLCMGKRFVTAEDAVRVDQERQKNAEIRSKAPFGRDRRQVWERALIAQGASLSAARRRLARWINTFGMTDSEIEASIAHRKPIRRT